MSESYSIEISGDGQAAAKNLADPSQVLRGLMRTMDRENQYTVAHIQRDYMSFPRSGPPQPTGTRVQTNRLRSSIRASRSTIGSDGIQSGIGSNVGYAGPIEFGCTVPSRPTRAKNKYYARKHPMTKAYEMEPRRPIQHGIEDRIDQYSAAFSKTIIDIAGGKS